MDGPAGTRIAAFTLLVLSSVVAVAVIVTTLQIKRLANQIESALNGIQGELSSTLRQTQATLERVDRLAQGLDTMVRDQVTPSIDSARSTLASAEKSVRTLTEGVSKAQRVAKAVQTVSGAGALAGLSSGVLRGRAKFGLAALAAAAVVQALVRHNEQRPKTGNGRNES
jgi:uncharacterized protein YoxC